MQTHTVIAISPIFLFSFSWLSSCKKVCFSTFNCCPYLLVQMTVLGKVQTNETYFSYLFFLLYFIRIFINLLIFFPSILIRKTYLYFWIFFSFYYFLNFLCISVLSWSLSLWKCLYLTILNKWATNHHLLQIFTLLRQLFIFTIKQLEIMLKISCPQDLQQLGFITCSF